MVTILIYNRDNAIKGYLWPLQKRQSHYEGSGGQHKINLALKGDKHGKQIL